MQYSEGNLGRVFVLRMDHGEDLIASLQKFLREKKIESCMALFMGALGDGRAVTGPEAPVVPPVPHYESFDSAWEVFGMATFTPPGKDRCCTSIPGWGGALKPSSAASGKRRRST